MTNRRPMYLTGASNRYVRAIARERGIGLLVQPGNGYGRHLEDYAAWAADNGAFSPARSRRGEAFDAGAWFAWLEGFVGAHGSAGCLFATAPDVLTFDSEGRPRGDAAATLEVSAPWLVKIRALGIPAALVAQDGLEELAVPWGTFDVLFIGGSDAWKESEACREICAEAASRGVPVHFGRVNSHRRYRVAASFGAATADGTFLAFGPEKNLPRLLKWIEPAAA